ncbi:hypothetical protein HAX54_031181, partial [Datura stramonium]|nr:hypothetical protein [Datura stramonium]
MAHSTCLGVRPQVVGGLMVSSSEIYHIPSDQDSDHESLDKAMTGGLSHPKQSSKSPAILHFSSQGPRVQATNH